MTWLAFRRHRTNLLILLGLALGLGLWMVYVAHAFEAIPVRSNHGPGGTVYRYRDYHQGSTLLRLPYQADAIIYLLLAFPAVAGALLGAPLVAGELDSATNRLAWTQGITRTRWLVTKWAVVGIPIVLLGWILALVTQWWSHHVDQVGYGGGAFFSVIDSGFYRIDPNAFSTTGVAPIAYTLFAFALGTALGAGLRRVSWAAIGTFLVYGVLALVMVTTVRPALVPQTFIPSPWPNENISGLVIPTYHTAWYLDYGYRFLPGSPDGGRPSADTLGRGCEGSPNPVACFERHRIVPGYYVQPDANYWPLQWRESLLYTVGAVLLLLVSLGSVRRWRA